MSDGFSALPYCGPGERDGSGGRFKTYCFEDASKFV